MANEIYLRHTSTGATLYATIRSTANEMWNTAGTPDFETLTVANWTSYGVALSESPASSYFYVGTFPAVSGNMVVGWYWIEIFSQSGGSPAINDTLVASYFGYWDGTTYKFWGDDVIQVGGTLQTAVDIPARLGAPAGASIAADIAATAAELAKVPKSDGSVGWNATARAQIQAEAEDANVAHGLDHLVSASVTGTDVADNSIVAKLASKSATADWDSFNNQTDSLEAIRDRGDAAWVTGGGGGGGPVTASVSVPAATARAVLQGSTIGVTRGDTLRVSLTDLGDLTGRTKLWFTVKQSKEAVDSAAIIQIEETDNLTLLNGATPSNSAWGTITVTDASAGDVDIVLYASATKLLSKASGLIWDVKQSLGSNPDDATTQMEGKMNVELNVTQATS